jgi:cation transporter-like permease
MGKYSTYTHKETSKKSREPHEIWRGLGCLLMLIIPVISIAASSLTVDYLSRPGFKVIPRQLLGKPRLPDFVYKSDGLVTIFSPVTAIEDFYAIAVVSLFYMLIIGGVISVIYAAVYSAVGPSRYGPTDAPPPKIKVVKKSR